MLERLLKLPKNHSFFLFGPRATGKSTLIKSTFDPETTIFFDLLNSETFLELSANPQKLKAIADSRETKITNIVLDEIQRIPELLNVVHQILESQNPAQFCLSGSSARKLKRGGANLLGGRAWHLEFFPFTHLELGEEFDLQKALEVGTLPKAYLAESTKTAHKFLRSYTTVYIEEEIKAEALVRDLRGFIKFLRIAASENGNSINFTNIARETMNKSKEIKEFFQILEDTLLGFFLLPYTKTTRKITKHPKFYFFDTGVQRALADRLSLNLERGSEFGKGFEHWFIKEFKHLNSYLEKDLRLSFYRTHAGAEVDLIIETPSQETYAIEIKSSSSINPKDLNGLKSFAEICPKAHLYCASLNEHRYKSGAIMICHWKELMDKFFGD